MRAHGKVITTSARRTESAIYPLSLGTAVTRREQRWLRVLLEPNLYCGRCPYCPAGRYNLRERLRVVGCQPGVQVLTTQYVITPMR